ncbi:MAG: hypothetical protein JW719_07185 [Pirellulales bacterium]|nr:hypothetical protein [Pirellulales bacterium]
MRSSTTIAARAIVMLACLVLIPSIALFGSSSPELVTKFLDGEWGSADASADEFLSEAPQFHPGGGPGPLTNEAEPIKPPSVGPPGTAEIPASYTTPTPAADPRAFHPPAGTPRLAGPEPGNSGLASTGHDGQTSLQAPLPMGPAGPTLASGPTSADFATSGSNPVVPPVTPNGSGSAPLPSEGGRFTLIQERLRDLGAVYYRLESWGSQQQLFRFQCEISVEGSPGLTRHFEAVENDPLLAMHKVLVEAEAWNSNR